MTQKEKLILLGKVIITLIFLAPNAAEVLCSRNESLAQTIVLETMAQLKHRLPRVYSISMGCGRGAGC